MSKFRTKRSVGNEYSNFSKILQDADVQRIREELKLNYRPDPEETKAKKEFFDTEKQKALQEPQLPIDHDIGDWSVPYYMDEEKVLKRREEKEKEKQKKNDSPAKKRKRITKKKSPRKK